MDNWEQNKKLVESLATRRGPFGDVNTIFDWIAFRNRAVKVEVDLIPFKQMENWGFDPETQDLVHSSGKFFSIRGLNVKTEGSPFQSEWMQPIIDQPEVGLLGIIVKEIDGVLCFLLQAKIEPGNINNVQLSPTLQATRSNYMRVHCGRAPRYLEYFRNFEKYHVWVDQLQSEQGGRFLHKRNRNIVLEINGEIPLYDDFVWVTLGQIKELMRYDNVVNMDTRTVLSGISPINNNSTIDEFCRLCDILKITGIGREIFESRMVLHGLHSIDNILSWFANLKSNYLLSANVTPLKNITEWKCTETEIVREDRKYFRVIGANISIDNREGSSWAQPLVQPMQEGICALILKRIGSVIHLLIQAKLECGNLDILEFAPTVQCLTGDYRKRGETYIPHYLEYVLNAPSQQILWDVKQSEEGGRFFQEQNRNLIILVDDDFPVEVPPNYCWMTFGQVRQFLKYNNYLNIQVRSLLAMVDEASPSLVNYTF